MTLSEKTCIACKGGTPPLPLVEIDRLKKQIDPKWELTHEVTRLLRKLHFKNFKVPMELAVKIGELAEEQFHHPELHIGWGHLEIEIWTHKINNLVESDFIFASKVDLLIKDYETLFKTN